MTKPCNYFAGLLIALGVFCLWPNNVSAAALFLNPTKGSYNVGDKIVVKVLASGNTSMNAVSGTLSVPPNQLVVDSISKAGSILNFWATEPSYSRSTGLVKFEGVSLSGFTGNSSPVLTITMHAIKEGRRKVVTVNGGHEAYLAS